MPDHTLTKRSGIREILHLKGDGSYERKRIDLGSWRQCSRCGMSENMIELLEAECEPLATQADAGTEGT